MHLSLVNLLVDGLDSHVFQFLSGEPLLQVFMKIHDLGIEQWQEDRDALASVPSVDVRDALRASEQTTRDGDHE